MLSPKDPNLRALDPLAGAITVGLCATWGLTQVAVKLALPDIPPMIQAGLRSVGAALVVALWASLRGVSLNPRGRTLGPGVIAGLLFGIEFILIYRGLVWTTASRAVLFLYTTPFFVPILSRWFLPADRFSPLQWVGLGVSFLGIVVAFGLPTPAADPRQTMGDLMILGGAVCWALTTIVIKATSLAQASAEKTLFYQLVVSAPIFALAALAFGEQMSHMPSWVALGSLLYQTVWVVGFTFLIWFWLILRYSANRLSAFTFLTPIFGVAAGRVVLDEPLTPAFLAALGLVTLGLVLVNRPAYRPGSVRG